jgi:hypothetical protein
MTPPTRDASRADGATGATDAEAAELHRRWRWRRRLVRVRRFIKGSLGGILLVVVVAVALVSQTGRGQDLALRTVLDRVRASLAGELTIDGVRSGTLLTGATLTGVRLDAEDGRPFLTADSVVMRYSLLSLVLGGAPIRSTTLWGADIEISQYSAAQEMNLDGLLAGGGPDEEGADESTRRLELGHIGIRRGRARVLTPASGSTRARIVRGPEGVWLRELAFEELDLDVEEVVLTPGAPVAFEARLASFTSSISIVGDPLEVREVFGVARFGDQGLEVVDAAFRLPESLLEGALRFGPNGASGGWTLRSELVTDGWADLGDLQWVDDRIPAGRFRGSATLTVANGLDLALEGLEVELEASQAVFDGDVRFADVMRLQGMQVTASPVTLARLEPWLGRELPLDGWLSGSATFEGTLEDLTARGRVTMVPTGYGGNPVTADFGGTIHRGASPGVSGFEARLDPLNYTVLEALWPDLPWRGSGTGTVRIDGRVDDGLRIDADLVHQSGSGLASDVGIEGFFWDAADQAGWIMDLDLDLRTLALGLFDDLAPDLGLQGSVSGPLTLDGTLSELRFTGDLDTPGGRVGLDGVIDPRAPTSRYALTLLADSVSPAILSSSLPSDTRWSGRASIEGSGVSLDSARVVASVNVHDSRVGPVRVDSLAASVRVEDGMLIADSLRANIAGVGLSGRGRIGLVAGRWGASRIDFDAPSLVGLRPLLMGIADSVMVQDGLSQLDREFLRAQGIEPDTLPDAQDVRLEGAVSGSASISGEIDDFDLGVIVEVAEGRYQRNAVDSARIAFTATGLPALTGSWQLGASANGILWEGRSFEQGGFEADMFEMDGDGRVEVVRRPGEQYRAVASFGIDSIGGEIDLAEASVQVGSRVWNLARPARIEWDEIAVRVDSVEIVRDDADPMHLVVDGTLTRGGESDFRVRIDGLHADQVLHVAQIEDVEIGGHVELDLSVRGTAAAPRIDGTFTVDGPRYGAMALTRLDGSVAYADRRAEIELEGRDGIRPVLTGSGTIPLDLGLVDVEDRLVGAPMDVRIEADSLDAAIALSYLSSLQGVVGWVSGEVSIRGTPDAPEPEGLIRLANAAWNIEEIGVRHSQVNGELRLRPDRTVEVALATIGSGQSRVSGTVFLEPVTNPILDLDFVFQRFLAVSRPDVEGSVTGQVALGGSYRRPVATGELTVDEGAIYMDELQRQVGVVDLSDPFLFDVGLAIDTTALASQPLLAGFSNPFFDNLRVDVDLSVPRGSWLRSVDADVELTGDLLVRYDRSVGDFVLIGELQAVRGTYQVLGRSFELQEGTVGFIGRPGLNPDLDILASTRIRRQEDAPIVVNAQVGGTLIEPEVTLSSEEAGLAEEDLVSYVVFGQPTSALGGGALNRTTEGITVGSALNTAASRLSGAFFTQVGSIAAQELEFLDYVSIQQAGNVADAGDLNAQLEIGRYVGEDLFVMLVWVAAGGADGQNDAPGVRVEWALTDDYNVEGYWEDRFLRSGSTSLATSSGLIDNNDRIWGVFLFREWGYGAGGGPQE